MASQSNALLTQCTTVVKLKAVKVSSTVITMTGTSNSMGFTAAEVAAAIRATISCKTNPCMVTWDGTDPTSTLGHTVPKDDHPLVLTGRANIAALKFLRDGGDSDVTVTLEQSTFKG